MHSLTATTLPYRPTLAPFAFALAPHRIVLIPYPLGIFQHQTMMLFHSASSREQRQALPPP